MELKRVAFEPMNEIHDKEGEILQKLLNAIKNRENLEEIFDEFVKDVENHFEFEQNLMEKYDFFAKIPHKMEHDRILNELYQLKNHLDNYEMLERYFNDHFLPWLENHIATMDTVTAGFFNMVEAKP
ncbi:bacteriohemerythrin [Caminibacter pacificus]